jgi:periplasmic divalent cation tolerance protein
MAGSDLKIVYITAKDMLEAERLSVVLVEEGHCACVNILSQMKSVYQWNGATTQQNEVVILAKTTQEKAAALIKKVEEIHSYETPCALVLPIESASKAYGEWLQGQLK